MELIVVSAKQAAALRRNLQRLHDFLAAQAATLSLPDLAFTLQVGRTPLDERWATVVADVPELQTVLSDWLNGGSTTIPVYQGRVGAVLPRNSLELKGLEALARHWVAGGSIDWETHPRQSPVRRIALPTYAFEKKRYWLTDILPTEAPTTVESKAFEVVTENKAAVYYDHTAVTDDGRFVEQYLSLAPLATISRGFSWSKAMFEGDRHPDLRETLLRQQRELRRVLWQDIDFSRIHDCFDLGCGLGSDLIRLGLDHPQLRGTGYTISARQAQIAQRRIQSENLADRMQVYARDSSCDPFPAKYDLIFGIEVAHHIPDKDGLFAQIRHALRPEGWLVLADCVANTVAVNSPATGSYTLNMEQYSSLLARHQLQISSCIDASQEIANFLHDPELEAVLANLPAQFDAEQIEEIVRTHRGWDHFGQALRQGTMHYLLLTMVPAPTMPIEQLLDLNRDRLQTPRRYSSVSISDQQRSQPVGTMKQKISQRLQVRLARILQSSVDEVDLEARFAELGVDSLTGLKFLDEINREWGLSLGAEVLYDHSSIADLAGFLSHQFDFSSPLAPPGGRGLGRGGQAITDVAVSDASDPEALRFKAEFVASAGKHSPPLPNPLPRSGGEGTGGVDRDSDEIAVIGLSVRLPGARNATQFWKNLVDGRDSVTEVPAERWSIEQHYSPDPRRADKSSGKWGGFLEDYDRFDPQFFSISPREAEYLDPQQRLFLEESWHALEDAGYAEQSLRAFRCGVYAGVIGNEYEDLIQRSGRPPDTYQLLGNSASILAARIAYFLNFKGPTLSIDTACSSSLVAIHLACQALQHGEIDLALAGGVTLYLTERPFLYMSRAGMLAADGKCKAFDDRADGVAPGEGVGVVVLKRLQQAQRDGDQIYGVIKASGVNQDGRTNGITAPSAASQTALIQDVYRRGDIDPASIQFVEAHGTGTSLGDPIEVAALTQAFQSPQVRLQSCALGSVKTNIGHTSAAAGVAGLVKVLLSLRHRQIPASLHFERANSRIRFEETPFSVITQLQEWRSNGELPRRAALSSFGFSGMNAHVVVEEATVRRAELHETDDWQLVTVSAKTLPALTQQVRELADHLLQHRNALTLRDVSFTLNTGRQHMPHRAAFVVQSLDDLHQQLLAEPASCTSQGMPTSAVSQLANYLVNDIVRAADRHDAAYREKLSALAELYVRGHEVDWQTLQASFQGFRVALPTYPFARERYWCDPMVPSPDQWPTPARSITPTATLEAELPWLFQVGWEDAPFRENRAASESTAGPLLVLDSDHNFVAVLRRRCSNDIVVQVTPGSEYRWDGAHSVVIRPDQSEDYERLAGELRQRGWPPRRVVHGWSDRHHTRTDGFTGLYADRSGALESVFLMSTALVRHHCSDRLRMLILASEDGTLNQAVQASTAGFARSAAQADPRLALSVCRLSTSGLTNDILADLVLKELNASAAPTEIRYVGTRRQSQSVRAWTPPQIDREPFPNGSVWLITGGLGGVGFCFARYLARSSSACLGLIGRSPLNEAKRRQLEELESLGAKVLYVTGDVTDRSSLTAALGEIRSKLGPVQGIVHAAGEMGAHTLLTKSLAEFRRVTSAKIDGACLLDELTAHDNLHSFVLCSSLAATVGDFGYGDYGAANRFLDEFAVLREQWRTAGLRRGATVSIQWPLWEAGGIQFAEQGRELFQQMTGMTPLTEFAGTRVLPIALTSGQPILLAAAGDREKLTSYLSGGAAAPAEPGVHENIPPRERRAAVWDQLLGIMSDVLHLPLEKLEPMTSFSEFGFDSITLKEFAFAIETRWRIALSPTVFYTHATLRDLAEHLWQTFPDAMAVTADSTRSTAISADVTASFTGHRESSTRSVAARSEPIAIIGMSGRFPQSRTLQEFWEHLLHGDDLVGPASEERRAWWNGARETGGFLTEVDRFDAEFFQISPQEAALMDPQQRLWLESVWQALEDAACKPSSLAQSRTAVYVGVQSNDYLEFARDVSDGQVVTGTSHALLVNRVSYLFDFRGPSEAIDTACSSSLVAVHRAIQSLRSGECDVAIAGGVNLILSPRPFALLREMGVLSPDGACKVFDRSANGYVRGEGVGVVVLKRLCDAEAAGDPIHAVIRGSAVNHNGRASSLTAPNPTAQARLIQEAWANADVPLETMSYLEAHGTGTELGDPLEIEGIRQAFAATANEMPRNSCGVGSLKSNLGHLEPASGIASLIKVVLSLKHRRLPATIHLRDVNPLLPLADGPLSLLTKTTAWSAAQNFPRRAGVSSFGFGGVNAHLVVEERPSVDTPVVATPDPQLILLSARNGLALRRAVEQLREVVAASTNSDDLGFLSNLACTLQEGRETWEHRLAFVASSCAEVINHCDRFLAGAVDQNDLFVHAEADAKPWRELLQPAQANQNFQRPTDRHAAAAIARQWVAGETINWRAVYANQPRRRLHLPGSPFAGEKHWIRAATSPLKSDVEKLLPVVSGPDGTQFQFTISPQAWYLRDHQVRGQSVLPAMTALELLRAAAAKSAGSDMGIELTDVTWHEPLIAPAEDRVLHIQLPAQGEHGPFAIQTFDGDRQLLLARGMLGRGPRNSAAPALDLAALRARCPRIVTGDEINQRHSAQGLHYGSSFLLLDEVQAGECEALGRVRPVVMPDERPLARLAVLDAVMQIAGVWSTPRGTERWVPFHVERVEFRGDPLAVRWAFIRRSSSPSEHGTEIDATLTDLQGNILVEIQGFMARPWKSPAMSDSELSYFVPQWTEAKSEAIGRVPSTGRALVFRSLADGGLTERLRSQHHDLLEVQLGSAYQKLDAWRYEIDAQADDDFLAVLSANLPIETVYFVSRCPGDDGPQDWRRLESAARMPALSLLRLCRALCRLGRLSEPLTIRVVTWQLHGVQPGDQLRPDQGTLGGLCRTLALEFPQLEMSCSDLHAADFNSTEAGTRTAQGLVCETARLPDLEVAWRGGTRYVQRLEPRALPATDLQSLPLRQRGVYWIIGGAGGLGAVVARHLAQRFQACVLLTGRREPDVAIEELLRDIERLGGEAVYRAVDATDLAAMQACVGEIKSRWGGLQGVIHSALVLKNAGTSRVTDHEFLDALAPKVQGAIVLEQVVQREPLDFVLFFSSAIALTGGTGQGNYAAASSFLDAFGRAWRQRSPFPIQTINWGYWGETGIVASSDVQAQVAQRGVGPILTVEGLDALERILAAGVPEIMPIKLLSGSQQLADTATPPDVRVEEPAGVDLLPETVRYLQQIFGEVLGIDPWEVRPSRPHETLGIDSLVMLKIIRRLEQDLGRVSKTLFFEHRTVQEVAQRLVEQSSAQLMRLIGTQRSFPSEGRLETTASKPAGVEPVAKSFSADTMPIAIIGVAGRYPQSPTLDELWDNLAAGRDCLSEIPPDRWDHRAYYSPDADQPGKTCGNRGGFLTGIDQFDPLFFGISPREAHAMDPQERLFLQIAWAALEDAGYTRAALRERTRRHQGRDVGVFVGVMHGNYQLYGAAAWDQGEFVGANSPYWSIANRVSYFCDFHGPSLAVDTACSSSLAAIHLACESLRRGECGAALAGGVNLLLHPRQYVILSQMKMLSRQSSCRPFGAEADGIVPGEGVGAVLLRPLDDALNDGDRILGVIRTSTMNSGGRTGGYTVPNPAAQTDLVRAALEKSGIDPRTITSLEAHGTGTVLGDPIEVAALTKALGSARQPFCALGSIKSNVGHLEAASGIAGVTKVLLQFQHCMIAPTLHCDVVNPHLDLENSPFFLAQRAQTWERLTDDQGPTPRRAGVSSFGAGGSNVHLILEEAISPTLPVPVTRPAAPLPILLSAWSEDQLRVQCGQLADHLDRHPELSLADIAWTLRSGRESMSARLATIVNSRDELQRRLQDCAEGNETGWIRGQLPRELIDELQVPADISSASEMPLLERIRRWTEGVSMDWSQQSDLMAGQRVALPTYPFAQQRHWVNRRSDASVIVGPAGLHPLVDHVEPSLDGACFVKQLTGDEFFLRDHVVRGDRLLPGVALLEAARAIGSRVLQRPIRQLQNVTWLKPLLVGDQGQLIRYRLHRHQGQIHFELGRDSQPREEILARCVVVEEEMRRSAPAQFSLEEIRRRCGTGLSGVEIYERMAEQGVAYGPRFQVMESIVCRSVEALAVLKFDAATRAELSRMPWHPAVFDGALQSVMGLLLASEEPRSLAPFGIEQVIAADSLETVSYAYVQRHETEDARHLMVDLFLLDHAGRALLTMQQVELRAWKLNVPTGWSDLPGDGLAQLEELGRIGLLNMFQRLGIFRRSHERLSRQDVMDRLQLSAEFQRLFASLWNILERRGVVVLSGETVTTTAALDESRLKQCLQSLPLGWNDFSLRCPELKPHTALLRRCLDALPDVLSGRQSPTEIFFPGGDPSLLEELYRGDQLAQTLHQRLANAVSAAVKTQQQRQPSGPVRILEIGSGTGSASQVVLDELRECANAVEFVYSDISPGLVQHGKDRFGGRAEVQFQVFDIERPLQEQGVAAGSFDLVIASNVLHATRLMQQTLEHVAALLVPGGELFLNEMTAHRDFGTLTFGLLPGWWLADDPERRLPDGPLLDESQWRAVLIEAGFEIVQASGEPNDGSGPFQQALFQCAKQSRRRSAASVVVPQKIASTRPIAQAALSTTGLLEQIEAAITRSVAEVFEMSEQQVAMGRVMSFRDFGADSILSAELIAKINASLQLSLKTTAIFNYPGVKELSRHIHEEFGAELAHRLASESGVSGDHPPSSNAAMSSSKHGFREDALPSGELAEVLRQLETGQLGFEDALARYVEEV